MVVAAALKGRIVHPDVELGITPGQPAGAGDDRRRRRRWRTWSRPGRGCWSRRCGPCIGLGFAPAEGTVSLRTFNRNFTGRSGTQKRHGVPRLAGDGRRRGDHRRDHRPARRWPRRLHMAYPHIDCAGAVRHRRPHASAAADAPTRPPAAKIVRGSTIVKPPAGEKLPDAIAGEVLIKVGDKITTDHIMPAGALLKYRSNVPEYAKYVFNCFNEDDEPTFAERAQVVQAAGQGGRDRRRRQLRPGLQPGARRPVPDVPRRAGGDRQGHRADPPGEPGELRHPAADVRGGRRLRPDRPGRRDQDRRRRRPPSPAARRSRWSTRRRASTSSAASGSRRASGRFSRPAGC